MKVDLSADGTLIVIAETAVEAFALRRWEAARRSRSGGAKLEIHAHDHYETAVDVFESAEIFSRNVREFQEWVKERRDLAKTKPTPPICGLEERED
jgi:predicted sulfurtransferase